MEVPPLLAGRRQSKPTTSAQSAWKPCRACAHGQRQCIQQNELAARALQRRWCLLTVQAQALYAVQQIPCRSKELAHACASTGGAVADAAQNGHDRRARKQWLAAAHLPLACLVDTDIGVI